MAVAFDAKCTGIDSFSAASFSLSVSTGLQVTVGSGSNRALVVGITFDKATVPAALTVTWGAQTMTQITGATASQTAGAGGSVSSVVLFGLVAPTSGKQILAASWTGTQNGYCMSVSFTGVDQTGGATSFPHGTGNSDSSVGKSNPATVTITSTASNAIVAMHVDNNTQTANSTSDTTIGLNSGGTTDTGSNYAVGVGTHALTCTYGGTVDWASAGTDIAAAGGVALPPGKQFFDPSLRRVREIDLRQVDLRTSTSMSIPLLASTLKPSQLGKDFTDLPPLGSKLPYPVAARTWIETGNAPSPLPQIPVGVDQDWDYRTIRDRALNYPIGLRTWIETGNALVIVSGLPPGENFTDRPQPRLRVDYTWIETPQTAVTAVTLPAGENYTDKPQLPLRIDYTSIETGNALATTGGPLPSYDWQLPPSMVDRGIDLHTWIATPSQPTTAIALPPGENYTDRAQPRVRIDYTWIETPQSAVPATLLPGENYTDRPLPVTWYREWLLNLQQSTLTPRITLPAGENYTDRPAQVTWYRDWSLNLQETTLTPTVTLPPGVVYTNRPQPITWYREWLLHLQQSTLTPTVTLPPGENYTDRPSPVAWLNTWTFNLQETTLAPTVTFPPGETYSDRSLLPISWYRDWSQNLLGNTLAIVYMPCRIVELPNPTPYPRLDQTWTQGPQQSPPIVLPTGESFTDRPQPITWYRDWSVNLQATTLAPIVFPTGEVYADRPAPVSWYRDWSINLQQTTLAPPPPVFPPGQVYADRPQPITWAQFWAVNLQEFTPVGPDVLPTGAIVTDLPQVVAQPSRGWESPYNVNLFAPTQFGPIPVRAGAVGRRRRDPRDYPRIDPWSRTLTRQHWQELQDLIRAEADAEVEADRRDDPALAIAADAASEVLEALERADETEAVNRDIARVTASLNAAIAARTGAERAAQLARELTDHLAMLEDDADCEILLFS